MPPCTDDLDVRPDRLLLPRPSRLFGRDSQWKALVSSYRRVSQEPGVEFIVCNDDNNDHDSSTLPQPADGKQARDIASAPSKIDVDTIPKSELVVIRGMAGTGKSSLAARLREEIIQSNRRANEKYADVANERHASYRSSYHEEEEIENIPVGFFVQGCFSHSGGSVPFEALAQAFNNLIDELLGADDVDQSKLQSVLRHALADDVDSLGSIFPSIYKALDQNGSMAVASQGVTQQRRRSSLMTADASSSLQFLFRRFVRSLCDMCAEYRGPLAIHLDDCECADAASMDLLTSILTDADSSDLLIILAVREETYGSHHPVHAVFETANEAKTVRAIEIRLENLTVEEVQSLVATAVRKEREPPGATSALSQLVHSKTNGNPFFVCQYLQTLVEKNLLEFSMSIFKWTWKLDRIKAETSVSDNVADMVYDRVQTLPEEVRFLLMIASCLHLTVDIDIEWRDDDDLILWAKGIESLYCPLSPGREKLKDALENIVSAGLMEEIPTSGPNTELQRYKFSHEKIRSASQLLISSDDSGVLIHLRVGEILRRMKNNSDAQLWMLFSCCDHLNICKGMNKIDQKHRRHISELNFQAGEVAERMSAFVPASSYFTIGIELIDEVNRWDEENYDLSLRLHTGLARSAFAVGLFEESRNAAEAVISRAQSLQEKLPCYFTLIAILKAQTSLKEAVDLMLDLLKLLGEKFEKKPSKFRVRMEQRAVEKLLQKSTDEQLLALPTCTNYLKAAAINVYGVLFGPLFHQGFSRAVDLLRLRAIHLSITYGLSDASALSFAYYGSSLISQLDLVGGYRYGKLALALIKSNQGPNELAARTILVANFLIAHWKDPLQETLDRLMSGYEQGMKLGDIEMAFTNAGLYQVHYYYCGMPLASGEQDIRAFCKQMEEYQQYKELKTYQPLWQTMLNLMGKSESPTEMTGDAMVQAEFLEGNMGVVVMHSYRLQLAYYFGDLVLAQEMMSKVRPHSNSFTAPFFQVARRFFFALVLMGLARQESSNKRKRIALLKESAKDIQWLECRVRKGAINCLHKLLILKAEYETFVEVRKKKMVAPPDMVKEYDKAIKAAGRSGFIQDEALANELAAVHFLSLCDLDRASWYITKSVQLYNEWGALGKVRQLEDRFNLIKSTNTTNNESVRRSSRRRSSAAGRAFKGRRRFSSRLSESHKSVDSNSLTGSAIKVENPSGALSDSRRLSSADSAYCSTGSRRSSLNSLSSIGE